jgi:hypothetical protein
VIATQAGLEILERAGNAFKENPNWQQSSLTEFDGELSLGLGHLAPEFLQIILQWLAVGLLVQSHGEPAICSGQVSWGARSG